MNSITLPPSFPYVSPTGTVATVAQRPRPAGSEGDWWQQLFDAPLSHGELAALQQAATIEVVRSGGTVFNAGDMAMDVVVLISGDVSLGRRDAEGLLRAERNLHGPAWLDAASAWLGRPHAVGAHVASDARIARLNVDRLQADLATHPTLARHVIASLARELRGCERTHRELLHKDAGARLASWLLRAALGREGEIRLHHRKRDMASELAITPETLSRLLARFSKSGLIRTRGYTVQILDRAALAAMAGE